MVKSDKCMVDFKLLVHVPGLPSKSTLRDEVIYVIYYGMT